MVRVGTDLSLYTSSTGNVYKRHILMLKTHDSLKTKKPTYRNSLSHVRLAEYLGYTEDFKKVEKKKLKIPTTFLGHLLQRCSTSIHV